MFIFRMESLEFVHYISVFALFASMRCPKGCLICSSHRDGIRTLMLRGPQRCNLTISPGATSTCTIYMAIEMNEPVWKFQEVKCI